ncbi:hypothetical protein BpHYR1_018437 [Brachionus plicatilis]|uniref:Uncharacterized protein n=1 Tax=Brachionus plicatilis TaxID=10195 RepID=A0A3M7QNM0_BRAPC|nr:hypothetical protein BpHYR1_018437 [Brachionus plicatilis]
MKSFRKSICYDLVDMLLYFLQSKIPKCDLYLNLRTRIVPGSSYHKLKVKSFIKKKTKFFMLAILQCCFDTLNSPYFTIFNVKYGNLKNVPMLDIDIKAFVDYKKKTT